MEKKEWSSDLRDQWRKEGWMVRRLLKKEGWSPKRVAESLGVDQANVNAAIAQRHINPNQKVLDKLSYIIGSDVRNILTRYRDKEVCCPSCGHRYFLTQPRGRANDRSRERS
jgi:ribosome-binding protein aMBF1 (putative translation factor)